MGFELQKNMCKCCGATLNMAKAKGGVIACEYCGSEFTIAKSVEPEALDAIRTGNHELDIGRFDDAYESFKKASKIDPEEPEAYIGMALSSFKIRYIKDENKNEEKLRLQPICYEIDDSVYTQDRNFRKAMQLATPEQKVQYAKCGEEIDYIRNEFYKYKQSGLDYDCFICVKVSDDERKTSDGQKVYTADYKTADDLYFHLKGKGYKPFFSEREIGSRTGADYEAMILYALYSSECMLVVCGKEEYLQTPWVKNEYSRFLKLVNDEEKESDSIAIVFGGKPIERLPGRKGKLQGIDITKLGASDKVVAFVDSHTPEAKKRREETKNKKREEEEERKRKIEEQEKALDEQKKLLEEQRRLLEELRNRESSSRQVAATSQTERLKIENPADWQIENGVLIKYNGSGGNVVIPDGVTGIGEGAFFFSSTLTGVKIPDSVTSIGNKAFCNCQILATVTIGNGVTGIGNSAFSGCAILSAVTIGNSVTSIGNNAFDSCESLVNLVIPNSVKSIGENAFSHCNNLTSVKLGEGLTSIGEWAFYCCGRLAEITIPDNVMLIEERAFCDCKNLRNIKLGNGLTSIEEAVFSDCGIRRLTIPDSVTVIGGCAFMGCSDLLSVSIPKSVKRIDGCAFDNCSLLSSVTMPKALKKSIKDAFRDERKHIKFTFI